MSVNGLQYGFLCLDTGFAEQLPGAGIEFQAGNYVPNSAETPDESWAWRRPGSDLAGLGL